MADSDINDERTHAMADAEEADPRLQQEGTMRMRAADVERSALPFRGLEDDRQAPPEEEIDEPEAFTEAMRLEDVQSEALPFAPMAPAADYAPEPHLDPPPEAQHQSASQPQSAPQPESAPQPQLGPQPDSAARPPQEARPEAAEGDPSSSPFEKSVWHRDREVDKTDLPSALAPTEHAAPVYAEESGSEKISVVLIAGMVLLLLAGVVLLLALAR